MSGNGNFTNFCLSLFRPTAVLEYCIMWGVRFRVIVKILARVRGTVPKLSMFLN